tara:strand:+ start:633 stop:866 length:234 start_codon:yes stop_codon:yes gene_type:complete
VSHWDKLQKQNTKKSIDRHSALEKKLKDVQKIIKDPDPWNVNLASRERLDKLEKRILELERLLKEKFDGSEKRTKLE